MSITAVSITAPKMLSLFDLTKAFDSVPHETLRNLCNKQLNPYILNGCTANIVMHRRQGAVVNGEQSYCTPMISRVSQCSVLGLLLFLIYIKDINISILLSSLSMYADDIAIYRTIRSVIEFVLLQVDID